MTQPTHEELYEDFDMTPEEEAKEARLTLQYIRNPLLVPDSLFTNFWGDDDRIDS